MKIQLWYTQTKWTEDVFTSTNFKCKECNLGFVWSPGVWESWSLGVLESWSLKTMNCTFTSESENLTYYLHHRVHFFKHQIEFRNGLNSILFLFWYRNMWHLKIMETVVVGRWWHETALLFLIQLFYLIFQMTMSKMKPANNWF